MINITYVKKYRKILTKSTVSGFHRMLNLKQSLIRATNKVAAYSINAMNMKKSEANANTDIPVSIVIQGKTLLRGSLKIR